MHLAHTTASLNSFAHHSPKEMPSLATLLGEAPKRQSGDARRAMMKAFAAERGAVRKKGDPA